MISPNVCRIFDVVSEEEEELGCIISHPGGAPINNLKQYLAHLLSGDEEASIRLDRFEEPDTAIWIHRLRALTNARVVADRDSAHG